MNRVLVQMSGVPGSGKSTLARQLSRDCGLVVVDHDVVKTALLNGDVPFHSAGALSYHILLSIVDDLLGQGHGVIVDSPCLYENLLEAGQRLARQHDVPYRYVECVVDDFSLLDKRLRSRPARRSQRRSIADPPADGRSESADGYRLFKDWAANAIRPAGPFLRLNTSGPLDTYVREAIAFLRQET